MNGMKLKASHILTICLLCLIASEVAANQPPTTQPAVEPKLWEDVRVIAAAMAAIVTLIINLLGKPLLDRWLESWKSDLAVKKAERQAKIDYELEAKKRLYLAVGPLRFQLLLAARDVANQVRSQMRGDRNFPITTGNYYGISTLHKIIRPFALSELIEEQITYSDFSVDQEAIDLLRFKRSAYAALSAGPTVQNHPSANWNEEEQHVYYNSINRIANTIIVESAGNRRVMSFPEFEAFLSEEPNGDKLRPLPSIYQDFSFSNKPLFGARLILLGYICAEFVNKYGVPIGFQEINYQVSKMLKGTHDEYIEEHLDDFCGQFEKTLNMRI